MKTIEKNRENSENLKASQISEKISIVKTKPTNLHPFYQRNGNNDEENVFAHKKQTPEEIWV